MGPRDPRRGSAGGDSGALLGAGPGALHLTAIAIEWHEAEELEEFLQHAEAVLGGPPGKVAKQLGAAGAESNMSGFLRRAAFYVARPEYAMKRVASAWRQFNDEGEMVLSLTSRPTYSVVEVRGASPPGPLFCETLTGWCEVLGGQGRGASNARATHTGCTPSRSEPHCRWRVTWDGIPGLDGG